MMRLGVCAQVFFDRSLPDAVARAAEIGFEAIELPVNRGNPFVDLDALLGSGASQLLDALAAGPLEISALSNHQEGQLLLGPHGDDSAHLHPGTPEEQSEFAARRLIQTAELARRLSVGVVCAFTGCEDYSRWFPWPVRDGFERMAPTFRERLMPVLDAFGDRGVRLALECHPRQFTYNTETALWAVELLDEHPALAFNFDPANLMLAGVEPGVFVAELGDRVVHVHAKDGEVVGRNAARSGLLAHGAWDRPDRGFRFRVPGWGDLDWRDLITELQLVGFDGVLAVEHEDPTMSRLEGLRKAVDHLEPLLLKEPPADRFW